MKSCLNCKHCHIGKDVEFDIKPDTVGRTDGVPRGTYHANMDMVWCEIPEADYDDFAVLTYGKPTNWEKEYWLPQLASVCENWAVGK